MIITCGNCESNFRVPKDAIGPNGRLVKCSTCDHEWVVKPEPMDMEVKQQEQEAEATPQETKAEVHEEKQHEPEKKADVDAPKEKAQESISKSEVKETAVRSEDEPKKKPPKRFIMPAEPYHKRVWCRYSVYAAFAASLLILITQITINNRSIIAYTSSSITKAYEFMGMYDIEGLVLEKIDCTIGEIRSSKDLGNQIEVEVDAFIKNTTNRAKKIQNIRFVLFDINRDEVGELIMEVGNTIEPGESFHIEGVLNRVPKTAEFVSIDYGNYVEMYYKNMNLLNSY